MIRLLLRAVAWLCDVQPVRHCSADGGTHYFGRGDFCQCGEWPCVFEDGRGWQIDVLAGPSDLRVHDGLTTLRRSA